MNTFKIEYSVSNAFKFVNIRNKMIKPIIRDKRDPTLSYRTTISKDGSLKNMLLRLFYPKFKLDAGRPNGNDIGLLCGTISKLPNSNILHVCAKSDKFYKHVSDSKLKDDMDVNIYRKILKNLALLQSFVCWKESDLEGYTDILLFDYFTLERRLKFIRDEMGFSFYNLELLFKWPYILQTSYRKPTIFPLKAYYDQLIKYVSLQTIDHETCIKLMRIRQHRMRILKCFKIMNDYGYSLSNQVDVLNIIKYKPKTLQRAHIKYIQEFKSDEYNKLKLKITSLIAYIPRNKEQTFIPASYSHMYKLFSKNNRLMSLINCKDFVAIEKPPNEHLTDVLAYLDRIGFNLEHISQTPIILFFNVDSIRQQFKSVAIDNTDILIRNPQIALNIICYQLEKKYNFDSHLYK